MAPKKSTNKPQPPRGPSTASLLEDRANLRRRVAELTRLNTDLDHQVRELLTREALTPLQLADFTRLRDEHTTLNALQNSIVLYMRNELPEELTGGELSVIVIKCLRGYKAMKQEQASKEKEKV